MLTSKLTSRVRTRAAIGTAALALASTVPASVAHAEWFYTKSGAQKMARDYVAKHYPYRDASDITTYCRPQGRKRADPRYKYHRWVCGWYDSSDEYGGVVLIVGSRDRSGYYGSVIDPASPS